VNLVNMLSGSVAEYSEYVLVICPGLNFDCPWSRATKCVNIGLTVSDGGRVLVLVKRLRLEDVLEVVVNVVEYAAEILLKG